MKTLKYLISSFLVISLMPTVGCQSSIPGTYSPSDSEPVYTSSPVSASVPLTPRLISPDAGAVLDNGRKDYLDDLVWDFDWSACEGATRYHLYVRHPYALNIAIDDDTLTSCHFNYISQSHVPQGNDLDWTWKVRAMVNGEWSEWSETRTFDVEPVSTDPPIYSSTTTPTPKLQTYNIKVSVQPNNGAGKVELSPPGGTYASGSFVTVKAEANSGYKFVTWSGDLGGTIPILQIAVGSNMNISAHFVSTNW